MGAAEGALPGERHTWFVKLGRCLCEVRAAQHWGLETLKSFDEFLARRFPESRRKAYYLMSIHEHLPQQARKDLKEVGWTNAFAIPHPQTSGYYGVNDFLPGLLPNYEMTQRSNPALSKPVNRKSLSRLPY
jgi:hypothetical protein